MVKLLLLHGGDPDARDTVSLETAFDVTSSSDIRDLLVSLEHLLRRDLVPCEGGRVGVGWWVRQS